jgi:hypothetical protein
MIAVDSSIIIDVIYNDPEFAEASSVALSEAADMGDAVMCDAALADVDLVAVKKICNLFT